MQFLRLALILLPVVVVEGQLLSSPDGVCKEGWECRKERHCPQYLDQKDRLKRLEGAWAWGGGGGHKKKLAEELAELVCNKEEGYRALAFKHLAALRWVNQKCDLVETVVKMDDDIFVDFAQILPKGKASKKYFC